MKSSISQNPFARAIAICIVATGGIVSTTSALTAAPVLLEAAPAAISADSRIEGVVKKFATPQPGEFTLYLEDGSVWKRTGGPSAPVNMKRSVGNGVEIMQKGKGWKLRFEGSKIAYKVKRLR